MVGLRKLYKCNRCSKIFNHKNDFRKHISRKNKCPIVADEPPCSESEQFSCPRCDKVYSSRSNLTRHLKSYCKVKPTSQHVLESDHDDGESIEYSLSDDSKESPLSPMKNDKPISTENESSGQQLNSKHMCRYCKKTFTRKDNMVRHQTNGCNIKLTIKQLEELELIKTMMEKLRNELAKLNQNNGS